ncbi:type III pantothenate kinase [Bacteroidota bacterium]
MKLDTVLTAPEKIATIDIGNSRLKILFRNDFKTFSLSGDWETEFFNYFFYIKNKPQAAGIASVNERVKELAIEILNKIDIYYIELAGLIEEQKLINCCDIKGMGQDRILGLIGGTEFIAPPLITVDCGTAVTINLLDSDFICCGGVIFPGPYTQLNALSQNTAGLKEVEFKTSNIISAKNTSEAIGNGIIYGIAGGIKEIIRLMIIRNLNKLTVPVILTGGGAKMIMPALDELNFTYLYKEDIVLRGILKLLERQYNSNF